MNSAGEDVEFNHPYLQATFMFLGEFCCLLAYLLTLLYQRYRPKEVKVNQHDATYSPFLMLPPGLCDVTATSLMTVGLTLTSASSYQMLRGSIMIFVGIFTVLFLRRRLEWFRWFGMFVIFAGLIVVGISDFVTVRI